MLDVKEAAEVSEVLCARYIMKFTEDIFNQANRIWEPDRVNELKKLITGVLTVTPFEDVTEDAVKEIFNEGNEVYTEEYLSSNDSSSSSTVTYRGGEEEEPLQQN